MTITVHHLNNSRSQRILWLLEELNVPYDIQHYARDAVTNLAPEALLKMHPLGKSPLIEDAGNVIFESAAIVEYICERHGGTYLVPASGTDQHIRYLEWLHFAEGSAMTPILLNLYTARLGEAAAPLHPRIDQQLESHFQSSNLNSFRSMGNHASTQDNLRSSVAFYHLCAENPMLLYQHSHSL